MKVNWLPSDQTETQSNYNIKANVARYSNEVGRRASLPPSLSHSLCPYLSTFFIPDSLDALQVLHLVASCQLPVGCQCQTASSWSCRGLVSVALSLTCSLHLHLRLRLCLCLSVSVCFCFCLTTYFGIWLSTCCQTFKQ